jgi:Na+-transporting methylmalonyl-CoA/oxaloacetate decarboxylase gamma subunit
MIEWGSAAQIALVSFGVVFLVLGVLAAVLWAASKIILTWEQRL